MYYVFVNNKYVIWLIMRLNVYVIYKLIKYMFKHVKMLFTAHPYGWVFIRTNESITVRINIIRKLISCQVHTYGCTLHPYGLNLIRADEFTSVRMRAGRQYNPLKHLVEIIIIHVNHSQLLLRVLSRFPSEILIILIIQQVLQVQSINWIINLRSSLINLLVWLCFQRSKYSLDNL